VRGGDLPANLLEYANVPRTIGAVISHRFATLHELQTVYSLQDVFDMLEVLNVDSYNQELIMRKARNGDRH